MSQWVLYTTYRNLISNPYYHTGKLFYSYFQFQIRKCPLSSTDKKQSQGLNPGWPEAKPTLFPLHHKDRLC